MSQRSLIQTPLNCNQIWSDRIIVLMIEPVASLEELDYQGLQINTQDLSQACKVIRQERGIMKQGLLLLYLYTLIKTQGLIALLKYKSKCLSTRAD